jgi:D-amino-acid oxidase
MLPEIPRRNFLHGALATGALLAATRANAFALATPQRRLAPVKVSRDRIIREVVGLRPYRDEGFVVAAERFGEKLLVHNYGHGGAGITLSWGTSTLAVDLARESMGTRTPSPARALRFAVLGAGVNGLSTARMLQRRYGNAGAAVTIYTKDLPPDTTSNIAGGFWAPTGLFDPSVATAKFNEQFSAAAKISNRAYQLLVGPEYGVRWIDTLRLYRDEAHLNEELEGGNDLYPAQQAHRDPENYFGFPFVRQYSTMLIEPQTYLRALLRDFYIAGGKLIVKEFRDRRELTRLSERVIFNCTGLGARTLFNDLKLGPVRGQLAILLPQPEIDYCYLGPGHMFPRHDGIVLGGTFDHDDWSLEPRADQRDNIIAAHTKIMKGLKS